MRNSKKPENETGYTRNIRIKLVISAVLLLVLALGFNTMLSLSSLENIYIDSTFSKYTAIGNDLKRNIEKSIKFGKNINKLIGMDAELKKTLHYLERDNSRYFKKMNSGKDIPGISLSIVLPDNTVQYSTDPLLIRKQLPGKIQDHFMSIFQNKDKESYLNNNYYKYNNKFYIGLPIYKKLQSDPWVGSIILILDESQVNTFIYKIFLHKLKIIVFIIASVVVILLGFFYFVLPAVQKRRYVSRNQISLVIILLLLGSQLLFSLLNTYSFKTYYLEITREKTTVLGHLLKEDIEYLLTKKITLKHFFMMEKMLGEILSVSPELSNITIFDSDMRPFYMADKEKIIDFNKSGKDPAVAVDIYNKYKTTNYNLLIDLEKEELTVDGLHNSVSSGFISITISKKVLMSELTGIVLDSITVLIISVLFLMELIVLMSQYFVKKGKKGLKVNFAVIRPAVFLYFFGQTISVSFLPLYMEQLYEPFFGLSKEMVMGLPICTTMLFGAVSPLIAGPWVDKRGWHEALFTGFVLTSLGFVYTWIAPNALHLIISRAFVGFGYGLTFMAANGFVVMFTDETSKARGLTYMIAGCFAGYICGSSTGGMLADRIGYNSVFIIGAVIIILSIIYTIIFMKNSITSRNSTLKTKISDQPASTELLDRKGQLLQFITDFRVLALCFFVILPSSMITVGFLNYFLPIYIDSIGSTPSNIGRLLMVHGLFFIYAAPFFSRFIDRSIKKSRYILLSGLICSAGLIIFPFYGGLFAAVLSVLLLGLSGSFEASMPYALSFSSTKELGDAKAMAILSSVEKIGQVIGPVLFGWLILGNASIKNLYFLGLAYLIIVMMFYIIDRRSSSCTETKASPAA